MQTPQITGISIGFCLIATGWLLRKILTSKGRLTAGGVLFTILGYLGALSVFQNLLFQYPATWSWEGVLLVWTEFFGKSITPIAFAFIGFLYRPNKVAGYVAALITFTVLMMTGSM